MDLLINKLQKCKCVLKLKNKKTNVYPLPNRREMKWCECSICKDNIKDFGYRCNIQKERVLKLKNLECFSKCECNFCMNVKQLIKDERLNYAYKCLDCYYKQASSIKMISKELFGNNSYDSESDYTESEEEEEDSEDEK